MTHTFGTRQISSLKFAFCVICCLCVISACGDSTDSDNQNNGVNPMQEINFSILHEGFSGSSGAEKEFVTLSTQQDYETKLSEFSSDSPITVDFSTQRVLFVSMGVQTSGGFTIDVTRIEQFSDGLVATAVLSSPGENCITTAALNNPYKFIQVTSQDDDIQVSEQNVTVDCT